MADETPPVNEFVPVTEIFEGYLKAHPEDLPKWSEYLLHEKRQKPNRRLPALDVAVFDYFHEVATKKKRKPTPVEPRLIAKFEAENKDYTNFNHDTTCGYCLEPFTELIPITTNLCGHRYHTQCMLMASNHGSPVCPIQNCQMDWNWAINREARRIKNKRGDIIGILLKRLKKQPGFKRDLQNLRTHLADVTKARALVDGMQKYERDDIIDKYADTLNQIQMELNELVPKLRESEEYGMEKQAISIARSAAKKFFNKYHLSIRDLANKDMLKLSWHARWAVEHGRGHRFVSYRSGIRLYPGRSAMFGYKNRGFYLPKRTGDIEFSDSEDDEAPEA